MVLFNPNAELREEAEQIKLSEQLVNLVASIIVNQLWMINHWGRGRPGEQVLQDIQRRVDALTGWTEG